MKKLLAKLPKVLFVVWVLAITAVATDSFFDNVITHSLKLFNGSLGSNNIQILPPATVTTSGVQASFPNFTTGSTVGVIQGAVTNNHLAKFTVSGGNIVLADGGAPGGTGTVTNFSFTNANGIAGVVTNPTTTPNLTLSLNNITPTSVVASGNLTSTGGNISANAGNISASGSITSTGSDLIAPLGNVAVGTGGSFTGGLILRNATGTNSTIIQAGASAPALTYLLPTAAPTANQFLVAAAPSGSNVQTSWASSVGGYQGINAYDIKRDFNASGSAQTTTGSITTGTGALTVASAIDFAVNQGIFISGAGTAGANYIGTITNIAGTAITVSPNVSTTVAAVLVQHDDTVAFRNAFTAMQAAGSKNILVKDGTYRWNPPTVDATCNALVCLPQVTRTAGSGPYTIGIYGENSTPSLGASVTPVNGAIIDSQQFSGAVSNFSAQIAAKTYVVTGTITTNEFNYVQVIIQNVTFRNKTNPALTAIQMNNAEGLQMYNVTVDNSEALTFTSASGFNTLTQPTNANSVGIITPGINNIGNQWLQNTWVTGYLIGYMFSDNERFAGTYAIQDGTCYHAHSGPAASTGTIGGYECTTLIDFISDVAGPVGSTVYLNGQLEGYTGAQWWATPNGNRIVDASNLGIGDINTQMNGTSATCAAGKTGGNRINTHDAFNQCTLYTGSSAAFNITQTSSADPQITGQYTATNDSASRIFMYTGGSAYAVANFRNNGIIGTDNDLYINPGNAKNAWMTFGNIDTFKFSGAGVFQLLADNGGSVPNYSIARNANLMTIEGGSAGIAIYNSAGSNINYILNDSGQVQTLNTGGFSFVAGGTPFGGTVDTRLARFGANIAEIDNGSACSTAANCVDLTLRHSLANGTAPTIASGFGTGSTIAGRDEAMRVTLGTTPGTGGVVTFGTTYTNAPVCSAVDETTLTVTLTTTPTTSNVTVTTVAGVILNADKIGIQCRSYR